MCPVALAALIADRLDEETRALQPEIDLEVSSLLEATTPEAYRRYLARAYSFIAPLERCLLDTTGLDRYLDVRRFRKHVLLEHDLQNLGLRTLEIQSLPQCMWIPWFEEPHTALGWAYIIERNTLAHPNLFRHLASTMPGEAAFGASFLKCYSGAIGEMWQSFGEGLEAAIAEPRHAELVIAAAKAGYRHFRRWRNTLDGKALSAPHPPEDGAVHSTSSSEPGALDRLSLDAPEEP
jgi:heme oxygenase